VKIRITQMTKDCRALGAYLVGSIRDGQGEILIDFEGVESETGLTEEEKKAVLASAITHEIHHAMSEFFGLEMEDPDGMCGGTEVQEMVVVPLEEHERIVKPYKELAEYLVKHTTDTINDGVIFVNTWPEKIRNMAIQVLKEK
jgi:hypothetical protein